LEARLLHRPVRGWWSDGSSNVRLWDVEPPGVGTPRCVRAVSRRGKHLFLDLGEDIRVAAHLGMSGRLLVVDTARSRPPHTHAILHLDAGEELRYVDPRRFGHFRMLRRGEFEAAEIASRLGPDALEVDAETLARGLACRTAPIKSALLDQQLLAGLGNIYADEILFAVGVHPRQVSNRLLRREIEALVEATREILGRAIRAGGSTLRDYVDSSGALGRFQLAHRVYGRQGQPCVRCSATIRRQVLAGRATHFCPRCQPLRRRVARPRMRKETTT
jgi:formamidopyrimidine-DNA glycosylase